MRPATSPRSGIGLVAAAICASAALSSAACGSTGTADPGPGIEAGPDAEPDAEPTPDASPVVDAGPDVADAKPDVVVPPAHFCAGLVPVPKFCDDFDDGDLTNDWTASAVQAAGTVFELDTSTSTSAPASFHVLTTAEMAAASNNALLRSTTLGTVSHAKLAFSVLLPSVTFTKGAIAIARFHITVNDSYVLYLRGPDAAGNIATLEENVMGVTTEHALAKLPTAAAWTRVAIDLDLVNGKASVTFDAQKALDAAPITVSAGTEATVRIGAIIDGPSDAFEAHFDDVVIDY
ncbi:MAG: hypothetical protein JWO86_6571 [Myxococcaceae bacterium]|nr:hypothetical protein [Myxococcaceae bacterium]